MDFFESLDGDLDLERDIERPLERERERLRLREREPDRGERERVRRRDLDRLQIHNISTLEIIYDVRILPGSAFTFYNCIEIG